MLPASQAANQAYQATLSLLSDMHVPAFIGQKIAIGVACVTFGTAYVVGAFFGAVFQIGAAIANLMLSGIDSARASNQDALNSTAAAAVSDILGVEIRSGDLPTQSKGGTSTSAFKAIGSKVLSAITAELGGTSSGTAGPGERAAQAFLGRGINFAVMSSLIGIVGELESLGFIKSFADIGEDMERVMGFGRLNRLAMQPLLHALVSQPYTREVNALYRPHQMTAAEYLTELYAGRMTDADVSQALSELGFSDQLIAAQRVQHRPKLHLHEVDAAVRWGKIDQQTGINMLVAQGTPADIAQTQLDALHLAQADAQERAYADEILQLAKQRQITSDVFAQLLQRLHMSTEEQQGYLNRLGTWLDSFHKRMSFGDLMYLYDRNLLTQDALDNFIAAEGYSADDAATLDLLAAEKSLEFQDAQKKKAAAAAAKAAKAAGSTPPPKA